MTTRKGLDDGPFSRGKAIGDAVIRLGAMADYSHAAYRGIRGFTVRAPRDDGEEYLVTVRRVGDDGGPEVAFHSATTLGEALAGLVSRLDNGSLKWRVDEYAR
jgi:hypothetical protein